VAHFGIVGMAIYIVLLVVSSAIFSVFSSGPLNILALVATIWEVVNINILFLIGGLFVWIASVLLAQIVQIEFFPWTINPSQPVGIVHPATYLLISLVILSTYLAPILYMNYLKKESFQAIFNWNLVLQKARRKKYAVTWISFAIIGALITHLSFGFFIFSPVLHYFRAGIMVFLVLIAYQFYAHAYAK